MLCPTAPTPRSAPSVDVVPASVRDVTANVSVSPPSAAPTGGWAKYQLRACPAAGCADTWVDCTPVAADGSATVCALSGLFPNTAYTVQARAVKDSLVSLVGSNATLVTRIS